LSNGLCKLEAMNAARYFMRREDYQPPQTLRESPFRRFTVRCLKCGSYRLQLKWQYEEQSGELSLVLFCSRCREQEILPLK
jgi:NMD protein affecting ribosome stability and mRNA decay